MLTYLYTIYYFILYIDKNINMICSYFGHYFRLFKK